jgi:hypothetical protein
MKGLSLSEGVEYFWNRIMRAWLNEMHNIESAKVA